MIEIFTIALDGGGGPEVSHSGEGSDSNPGADLVNGKEKKRKISKNEKLKLKIKIEIHSLAKDNL